ncbi:MAG: gamma-glutamyl-gamma-aminobutyrate hydrolase family protein [Thermodesulfobacteriota bacterium]|jgi:putative glutamine amidotransferase
MRAPAARIGLTMRSAAAKGETRDAISRDWSAFMAWALPNTGEDAARLADPFALDALIQTGGDDLGADPLRDATERALLERALRLRLPVFGVCRGLQFVNAHLGGTLTSGHEAAHADTRFGCAPGEVIVNSYHGQAVPLDGLAPGLAALAGSRDGLAEAVFLPGRPLACVQWHPAERERPFTDLDARLSRDVMGWRST